MAGKLPGHKLKKAYSVAPRLKPSTVMKRAKHELSELRQCADSVH